MAIFERGKKGWKKSTVSSGLCFTISFDRLEEILKDRGTRGKFLKLNPKESIKAVRVGKDGITVFIGD